MTGMELHDLSAAGDVLERVTRCAQQALAAYGCHPATTVRLLNVSENATFWKNFMSGSFPPRV